MGRKTQKVLGVIMPDWLTGYSKRKPVVPFNPTRPEAVRPESLQPVYTVFRYNAGDFKEGDTTLGKACSYAGPDDKVTWINVDGLKKEDVESLSGSFDIHPLIVEDILSSGQRAKMDETDEIIFCLLPMLYYNEGTGEVETEQVSIVLGKDFVISFQEDKDRDVFDPVRERIRSNHVKTRKESADYLLYSLVDVIVDSYFNVLDKINERLERLEDALILEQEQHAIAKISILRRVVIDVKRYISPVRDLVAGLLRSDSDLLEERHEKYYKDVLDHITQANEYIENYREMLVNLQDLSMSQVNTKMNKVMKIFTMVATLLAPATVIGGIFGMNFDVIPLAHQREGFYFAVTVMLVIPLIMLIWFKRRGWFD
ncbi:MAG: magnesium/cobalt transporter CorA [Sphingobacteriales bacterium]|nr:MAG: magnesium/cobalt transporter CorA [Sphingobacteriales bacterium]